MGKRNLLYSREAELVDSTLEDAGSRLVMNTGGAFLAVHTYSHEVFGDQIPLLLRSAVFFHV